MMVTFLHQRLARLLAAILVLMLAAPTLAEDQRRPMPRPFLTPVVEITAVQPFGPAYRAGLEVGDRIFEVDGTRVRSLIDLRRLLHEAGYSARLTVLDRRTAKQSTVYVYPENGRIGIDARLTEVDLGRWYPY